MTTTCTQCSAPLENASRCDHCGVRIVPVPIPAVQLTLMQPLGHCLLAYRHKGVFTLGRHDVQADVPVRIRDNLGFLGISRQSAQIVLESSRATIIRIGESPLSIQRDTTRIPLEMNKRYRLENGDRIILADSPKEGIELRWGVRFIQGPGQDLTVALDEPMVVTHLLLGANVHPDVFLRNDHSGGVYTARSEYGRPWELAELLETDLSHLKMSLQHVSHR